MNRDTAQRLVESILDMPRDGELLVGLNGVERVGTRFNDCAVSQNVLRRQATLTLTARLGQKQTSTTLNTLDDPALIREAIARVFATCSHMPDDDEVMPAVGEVIETREQAFSAAADEIDIETTGGWVAAACRAGADAGVDLAGLLSHARGYSVYGDSAGGFAHERHHRCDFHVTATGTAGSGWAEHQGISIGGDDLQRATQRAIDKCVAAQSPRVFEPRPVTVILEAPAVGELMAMAAWYGLEQRAVDEGRSAFSDFAGDLGKLSLYSDPAEACFPALSFNSGGERLQHSTWLDQGRLQQLFTGRYWAQKQGLPVKPAPNNLVLEGAGTALDELIRGTPDGILVTRFWYIRATDPKTLGFTGMTRDGTYRIENGEITGPVVDMRWNDSVLRVLGQVSGSGAPVATGDSFVLAMPALKVDEFHFTSLSN